MSSLRRLMKEATELSTTPSPDLHAAPTDDTNLYDWHFTISGPPSPSPYSAGIYHGRITFPATYPLRPPSFRFLTPSGRFEVNREICLSISGHHEESWQPAWGVRTALVAIRSFMDADAKGQVGGLDVEEGVRRELARESREWVCSTCGRSNLGILREGELDSHGDQAGLEDGGTVLAERQPGMQLEAESEAGRQPEIQPEAVIQPGAETQAETQAQTQPDTQAQAQAQAQPQVQAQAMPQTQVQTQAQTNDWLDKAIIAVLVALVIMITRRILNAQLDDYL